MQQLCHRCGAAIDEADPFCPHCGSPQLRYEAPDESAVTASVVPAQRLGNRGFDLISWRDAIHTAAILAVPTGILSAVIGFYVIWVLAGGVVAVSLYRRRTGLLPTGKMGWRIGMLFGLFAAVIAAAFNGVALLVQRYGFHQGAAIDQRLHEVIDTFTKAYAGYFGNSSPDMAKAMADSMHFWLTANGVAALVLTNAAETAIFMLLFAAVGGALAARFTAKAPQHSMR
jgi:hypothetical protein